MTVRLGLASMAEVDAWAADLGCTRSTLFRAMLATALLADNRAKVEAKVRRLQEELT